MVTENELFGSLDDYNIHFETIKYNILIFWSKKSGYILNASKVVKVISH